MEKTEHKKLTGNEKFFLSEVYERYGEDVMLEAERQIDGEVDIDYEQFGLNAEEAVEVMVACNNHTDYLIAEIKKEKANNSINAPKTNAVYGSVVRYETLPDEIKNRIIREEKRHGYSYKIDEGFRYVFGKTLRDIVAYING